MISFDGHAHIISRAPTKYASQEAIPMRDIAYEPNDAYIRSGFPVTPKYWATARGLASAQGEFLSTARPGPTDVNYEAHSRFLPEQFDDVAGTWRPFFTGGVDYFWRAPAGLSPNKSVITYRIGREVLEVDTLRFNPGDYLLSSFNNGADDASQFSVAMAFLAETPLEYTIFSTQNEEQEITVRLDSGFHFTLGNLSASVNTRMPATAMVPCYLLLSSSGSTVKVFVGTSSRKIFSGSIFRPSGLMQQMRFTIGKAHAGKATATMNLMEFSLFDYAISTSSNPMNVYEVFNALSSIYGVST